MNFILLIKKIVHWLIIIAIIVVITYFTNIYLKDDPLAMFGVISSSVVLIISYIIPSRSKNHRKKIVSNSKDIKMNYEVTPTLNENTGKTNEKKVE